MPQYSIDIYGLEFSSQYCLYNLISPFSLEEVKNLMTFWKDFL